MLRLRHVLSNVDVVVQRDPTGLRAAPRFLPASGQNHFRIPHCQGAANLPPCLRDKSGSLISVEAATIGPDERH